MALDINGYNATFKAFTDFATQSVGAGKTKAIARVEGEGGKTLAGRTITAAKHDWVGIGVGRLYTLKDANNIARDLFKNAVIEMFGSEKNIPDKVRDAMKMADYDKGKPLTARRILAVKNAIDLDGTAAARSKDIVLASISEEAKAFALKEGYVKSELPKLARATKFLAEATNMSELEAMKEVATPGSKANRLMDYGGRFMESAENFKEGLRLIDLFESWHGDLSAAVADIREKGSVRDGYDYSSADTPSKLNAETCVNEQTRIAMEKFVFEEIATKPSVNLKEQDGEKIFGFKNNNASRFIGQNFGHSCTSTIANIPPAKRETVFRVLNLFCSLAETPDDQKTIAKDRFFTSSNRVTMIARVLRHFDEIAALDAKGKLTAKNIIKTCCPDMVEAGATGNWDIKAVTEFLDEIDVVVRMDIEDGGMYSDLNAGQIGQLMGTTGGTLDEVAEMLRGGKKLPKAQYVSEGQMSLAEFGTVKGGRKLMKTDLDRGVDYVSIDEGKNLLGEHVDFGFNFPGEERFVTNRTEEGRANIERVGDKVEAMCGKVHPKQAASVMAMLSQSGLGVLKGGLEQYGVRSEEHSVVDFTFTRNEDTGDVTIRYSSPKELPFVFEWTATIKTDGSVSTTPLRFTDAKTLQKETSNATNVITEALISSGHPDKAAVDRIVASLIEKAKGDRELLSLLTAKDGVAARNIAMTGTRVLRSDEEIMKHLEALRANVDELRMAAGGDKRVFDIAMKQLQRLGGKALPSGTITQIVELTAKADVSALKGLSAKSSASALAKAMCDMDRIVTDICGKTQIMKNFGFSMAAESSIVASMIMGLVFARMDAQTLNGIKATFFSNTNVQVKAALDKLDNYEFPHGSQYDKKTGEAMHRVAHSLGWTFRMDFGEVLCDALGQKEADQLPDPEEEIEPDPDIFKAVNDLVEKLMTEVHHDLIPDEVVRG